MVYFERCTGVAWASDRSVQTSVAPEHAAYEFSWDHPGFSGLLEVVAATLIDGRPSLVAHRFRVRAPGQVSLVEVAPPLKPGQRAAAQ